MLPSLCTHLLSEGPRVALAVPREQTQTWGQLVQPLACLYAEPWLKGTRAFLPPGLQRKLQLGAEATASLTSWIETQLASPPAGISLSLVTRHSSFSWRCVHLSHQEALIKPSFAYGTAVNESQNLTSVLFLFSCQ